MSFSDMMSSGRGPGFIGMIMALFVLVGFGLLFMFAFDEGMQGGAQSIESVIKNQGKEIETLESNIANGQKSLDGAPERVAASKDLVRLGRENVMVKEKIATVKTSIETANADIVRKNEEIEAYKATYRTFVRGGAKGQSMDQLVTVSGVVYKNVNIRDVTAIGIQIRHDDGQKRIPFEELPDAMKDHFQFDPKEKEMAVVAENTSREEHEAAVEVTSQQEEKAMAERRVKEAGELREKNVRNIALKEARINQLKGEIDDLEDAIIAESRKTVSKASLLRAQISNKRREISDLQAQISSLRANL